MTVSLRRVIFASLGAAMLLSPMSAAAQGRPGQPCAPHDRGCSAPQQAQPQHTQPQQHGRPQHGRPQHGQPPQAQPPHAKPQPHRPVPPMAQAPRHKPQHKPQPPHAVRPGHSASKGQPFQRGKNSRFHPPPRGQEYRVVNNHLVLADSKTLKIMAVMGLMNELLK